MTIGERIKYIRKRTGITQAKLAELAKIHPVSIRKYETNKMIPQLPQIIKIATALGVSSSAITGIENNIQFETIDDFIELMVMLCKSKIIIIEGERDENKLLKPKTVFFKINTFITQFFKTNNCNIDDILYVMKDNSLLLDILKFERTYYSLTESTNNQDNIKI